MTTTPALGQAEADAEAAKIDVDRAEQEIVSGSKRITAAGLHKLRDAWRHADLTAQGARRKAEQDRIAARLDGLERIGVEVDRLGTTNETAAMSDALRDIATACARFRGLAAAHDETVAELVAAATDLGAEPEAPGGPRPTSAHVAVNRDTITHRRTKVSPVGDCADALSKAMQGDVDAALAGIRTAIQVREPKRPDYLLRGANGMLITIIGDLTPAMAAQIRDPNSGTQALSDHEIDLYMDGELR